MIRALMVACLWELTLADKWGKLQHCTYGDGNYCYGYFSKSPKEWCYLTSDGEKDYVKEGTAGFACKDYDTYPGRKYCEDAKTELKEHATSTHPQPLTLGKLKGSTYDKEKYCYGYMTGQPKKWCWLTSDGLKDFVKEGTGGHKCSSYDTYKARTYCDNAKSSADARLFTKPPAGGGSGAFGIDTILASFVGKKERNGVWPISCKRLCKYFGSSSHHYGSSYNSRKRTTTCTCTEGAGKVIKMETNAKPPFKYCKLLKLSGSATPAPPPAPPAPAGELYAYIANFAKKNDGVKVARISNPTKTSCWDLPKAAIEAANRDGFNVGGDHSGPNGWVWSKDVVPNTQARPGDIAQFVHWSEKSTRRRQSKGTGSRHSAIVTGAYDASDCSIEMYDQNPSPNGRNVYHTCNINRHNIKRTVSGSLVIYRLTSDPPEVEHRLYSDDAAPQMKVSTSLQIVGCGMAVAMVSLGFVAWRAIGKRYQARSQNDLQLLTTEETDPEMLDAATGLE